MSSQQPQNFRDQHATSTSPCKSPISERKLRANRQNACLSTGPRTARGKRTVARNAMKHGLLAREVVITAGEGAESQQEFDKLVEGLRKDFDPVGALEESLAQTIAVCLWRKARLLRAENGEIRKRLDTAKVDHAMRARDKVNLNLALVESELGWFSEEIEGDDKLSTLDRLSIMQATTLNMMSHRSGLEYLSALLERAKSDFLRDGYMSQRILDKIVLVFSFCDHLFTCACMRAGPPEKSGERQRSDCTTNKQVTRDQRTLIIAIIDEKIALINELLRYTKKRAQLEMDSEARSLSLPSEEVTGKLIRYETHLDRQLYRAMNQLERLQRLRRGENVPPPLNIDLGRRC